MKININIRFDYFSLTTICIFSHPWEIPMSPCQVNPSLFKPLLPCYPYTYRLPKLGTMDGGVPLNFTDKKGRVIPELGNRRGFLGYLENEGPRQKFTLYFPATLTPPSTMSLRRSYVIPVLHQLSLEYKGKFFPTGLSTGVGLLTQFLFYSGFLF